MKALIIVMTLLLSGCASTLTNPQTGNQFAWPFFGFSESEGFDGSYGHAANAKANAIWSCEAGNYETVLHCVDASLEAITYKPYKAHWEGGNGLARHRKDKERFKVDYYACETYSNNAEALLSVYGIKGRSLYAWTPFEPHMGYYVAFQGKDWVFDINYGLMPLEEFNHVYDDATFNHAEFIQQAVDRKYVDWKANLKQVRQWD